MTIKAAFFDIDNTLYDWRHRCWVQSGLDAIKKIQKKGVKVFVCTARSHHLAVEFNVFKLGFKWDGYITSAGAIAYYKGEYLYKSIMPPEMVRTLIKMSKERGCPVEIVTPKDRYLSMERNEYIDVYQQSFPDSVGDVRQYRGGAVTGLILFGPEKYDKDYFAVYPDICWFRFNVYGVDVSHEPHEKGIAIAAILKKLGLKPEEAIGFGDDIQDMTMKGPCGTFVCVGNGRDEVKAVADYVCPPIDEDGIEEALKHFGVL